MLYMINSNLDILGQMTFCWPIITCGYHLNVLCSGALRRNSHNIPISLRRDLQKWKLSNNSEWHLFNMSNMYFPNGKEKLHGMTLELIAELFSYHWWGNIIFKWSSENNMLRSSKYKANLASWGCLLRTRICLQ